MQNENKKSDDNAFRPNVPVFIDNISGIKNIISKKAAYNLSLLSIFTFSVSLFLTWSQANIPADNLSDSGYLSGWSEQAYFCILPLLFVSIYIISGKKVSIFASIGSFIISVALIVNNNIINRTTWTETRGTYNYFGNFVPKYGTEHNAGSDLGVGFWIGIISLFLLGIASIAWSVHTYYNNKTTDINNENTGIELKMDFNGADVKAILNRDGIIVKKGSYILVSSLKQGNILFRTPFVEKDRERMIKNGKLNVDGDKIYFIKDVKFNSANAAAQFLTGDSRKGKTEWKDSSGVPLSEIN